jgi:hypothetical protein
MKKIKYIISLTLISILALPALSPAASFKDTTDHWAKDSIEYIKSLGHMQGYSDGAFRPDQSITRAEFIIVLAKSLNLTINDNTSKSFSDTGSHYAKAYINAAVARNIILPSEYPNGLKPDDPIKRSEVAAMLVRALGESRADGSTSFKDDASISQSMYNGEIKKAADLGLMSGDTLGNFNPFSNLTRAQTCQVMYTYINKQNGTSVVKPSASGNIQEFKFGDESYLVGIFPLVFNNGSTSFEVKTINASDNTITINNQYSFTLNSNTGNPDVIIKNRRYALNNLTVSGNTLIAKASYRKINSMTYIGDIYKSEDIPVTINSQTSIYNLSNLELIDLNNARLGGQTYNFSTDNISIDFGDGPIRIKQAIFTADDTYLELYSLTYLSISDILGIFVDNEALNFNTSNSIYFVIDGSRYELKNISVNQTGNIVLRRTAYTPSQVKLIVEDYTYQPTSIQWISDKLIIYCSSTVTTGWVMINSQYYDSDLVKIIKDDIWYDVDELLVVRSNTYRIGGRQYTLSSAALKCYFDNQTYQIKSLNYDDALELTKINTSSVTSTTTSASQPNTINFYKSGNIIANSSSTVYIYADGTWQYVSNITIPDPAHFTYNGKTYNLINSTVKIGSNTYTVIDTAWHGGTMILDIYMSGD